MDNLPQSFDSTKTLLENTEIAFIGCGVMAESIVAGILRQNLVKPEQIAASHPRGARREELRAKYGINVFGENVDAVFCSQFFPACSARMTCSDLFGFDEVLSQDSCNN